jgi:hypothetical protein
MVNEHPPLVPPTALNAGLAIGAPRRRVARRAAFIATLATSIALAHAFTVGPRTRPEPVVGVATPSVRPPASTAAAKPATKRRRLPERKTDRGRRRHRTPATRPPRRAVSAARVTAAPERPAPTAPARPARTPEGFTEEFF